MSKNICFFNSNFDWGGGEKWHFNTARELALRGYKVHFFTSKNSKLYIEATKNNFETSIIKLNNLSFLNFIKVLKLSNKLKKQNFTAIIMNLPADVKSAGIAAKLAGIQKIIYRRGMPHPIKNSPINRLVFGKIITNVIANSQTIKESITAKNNFIIDNNKIKVIYNSINFNDYEALPDDKVYHKKNREIVIGNVGRLVYQKGQKYLIELAAELMNRNINFKILIAGTGPLKQELQEYAKTLKVESNIIFTGFITNIRSFMNSIDLFAFPSLFEGSANTILEAMSFGKPVLTHNTSSMPELIKNEINGYVIVIGDVKHFADKVELLINNNEKYKNISERNIKEIKNKYSTEQKIDELISLF